jgi:hypothetical protein
MDLQLKPNDNFLSTASIFEIGNGLVNDKKLENAVSFPAIPSLEEMLKEVGPLPKGSLFFGYAEDELPVLLNLRISDPGPILISGDVGAGKTSLLKVLAKFVAGTCDPHEIQLGVITDHPGEWNDRLDSAHCVGLFAMREKDTVNFIKALEAWTSRKKSNQESVLLLIDGLNDFACWNSSLIQEMHNILLHGPSKQIWTIATFNPKQCEYALPWLKYFHARIFGYTTNHEPGLSETKMETLSKGREFFLKESAKWIKFHIPKV